MSNSIGHLPYVMTVSVVDYGNSRESVCVYNIALVFGHSLQQIL